MYEKAMAIKAQYAAGGQLDMADATEIQMPTVGENIDRQIERHMAAIRRLEETRRNLDKANLLGIRISDLHEALSY